ncbi:MAG TPA: pilus assembly protein [Henriciella marina]|uniref:TadE/TadG family type IV pilus assembly protein n=1 Tax=Henriciella sp. TaxID=1968823 RepID=UPI0017AD0E46|nr:TadE/TadG family type IV pilus assembly protein [Henriciella sp.]HIG22574.1 pilus assembly protein [Henriciella sp.]HIK65378.1 pilus assembly protein [Henriciella marina]
MKRIRVQKWSLLKRTEGSSAVEFAIVTPVLLFLLFGIIAYGIFFGAVHSVQQLAANSARAAISGLDLAERQALVEQHLASSLPDGGLLTRDAVSVSVETLEDDSSYLRVVVAFDASDLPVWNLYSGLPLPEKTIRREAIIRAGGY